MSDSLCYIIIAWSLSYAEICFLSSQALTKPVSVDLRAGGELHPAIYMQHISQPRLQEVQPGHHFSDSCGLRSRVVPAHTEGSQEETRSSCVSSTLALTVPVLSPSGISRCVFGHPVYLLQLAWLVLRTVLQEKEGELRSGCNGAIFCQ